MVEGYPEPLFGTIVVTGGVDSDGETLDVPDEITMLNLSEFISQPKYVVK
jgi:hypothetical protein